MARYSFDELEKLLAEPLRELGSHPWIIANQRRIQGCGYTVVNRTPGSDGFYYRDFANQDDMVPSLMVSVLVGNDEPDMEGVPEPDFTTAPMTFKDIPILYYLPAEFGQLV